MHDGGDSTDQHQGNVYQSRQHVLLTIANYSLTLILIKSPEIKKTSQLASHVFY